MVILITGQAGTGKTTAARQIRDLLCKTGRSIVHIDGDVIRKCWTNVKYDKDSRILNLERIRVMTRALLENSLADDIIISVVAPIAEARDEFYYDFGDIKEIRLTKIHKLRPESFYCEFEESSEFTLRYQGVMGLATLMTELESRYGG